MAYVLDSSAIMAVLLATPGAEEVVKLVRGARRQEEGRVLVPFTVMEELELYLLRHLPGEVSQVLALVEGWPVEIVETYPQWRHEAVRLQDTLNLPPSLAWAAALAFLHNAQLVHADPSFEAIPDLAQIKVA